VAAATYTTDLTGASNTLSTCEAITGWAEPTAAGWVASVTPIDQTENYIQGTHSISATGKTTGVGGHLFNAGSGQTMPTDGAFLMWGYFASMGALDTEANGGMRLMIGNSLSAFYGWKVAGKDSIPYGGWHNFAVNPTVTPDYTAGTPSGTWQYFGFAVNALVAISKGEPYGIDVARYGRCEARFAGGDGADADATFLGFATVNDDAANRWGLIQAVDGGYLWKGLMVLGYAAAVVFTDSNTLVLVENTKKVTAGFNKIEIRNASSVINWTSINFLALGTVSKGRLEVVDDCDVNIAGCSFTGMDTFIFKAASAVLTSTFRNCGVITANSADFAGTKFEGYAGTADTSYMDWNTNSDPGTKLANCSFVKGSAAAHALSFTDTNLISINLPNSCTFSGYSASNGQTDSALYFAKSSGSITVYYNGTVTYKSAGATITISASNVDVTLTGLKDNSECRVYTAGTTTELAGTENATTGTTDNRSFTFSLAAATSVDIRVFAVGYLPADILAYTVPTSAASIPVQQIFDRVYQNL